MSADPPNRSQLESLDNEKLYEWAVIERLPYAQHVFSLRFTDLLRLSALRIVADLSLAEDVAADTLRRVFLHTHPPTVASVPAYLYRINRNAALNALNSLSRQRRFVESVSELPQSPAESVHSEEEDGLEAATQNVYADLRKALSRLRPDQCKALEMFYFDDLSYVEIAERLDTPVETIKSHLQNGRKRLRHLLTRV